MKNIFKLILVFILIFSINGCITDNQDVKPKIDPVAVIDQNGKIVNKVDLTKIESYRVISIKDTPVKVIANEKVIFNGVFVNNGSMSLLAIGSQIDNFKVVTKDFIIEEDGYLLDNKLIIYNSQQKTIKLKFGR